MAPFYIGAEMMIAGHILPKLAELLTNEDIYQPQLSVRKMERYEKLIGKGLFCFFLIKKN